MKFTLLTVLNDTISANVLKTKLESEEIPCFLHNENITGLLPHAQNVLGSGVRVMVPKEFLEKAIEIANLGERKLACPDCGSDNLINISSKRRQQFKLFFIILVGIIGNLPSKYSCQNCGYLFKS